MFRKVAIIGPGLIGGSMGIALRQKELAELVVGIGRREESLQRAVGVGAVDETTLDVREGVHGADLVVLATPADEFQQLAAAAAPALKPRAIVTDVASTKVKVIETISATLRERPEVAYIPTHPMAGSEHSGPLAARGDLFQGAVCIITPLTNTFPETKSAIVRMWESLGAHTVSMTPQAHDRLVARISHTPHLAAAALMALTEDDEARLGGGGLRDTTRVASGDPDLWVGICRANRGEVHAALRDYIAILEEVAASLRNGDLGYLKDFLQKAKRKRDETIANEENSA
ncbi:MAG: prephenate dehydrogenase/arogenate dehydrogenase family protein [Candidatus Brocadiaceae bacterium]|jgi:prephenate dehydrogenase